MVLVRGDWWHWCDNWQKPLVRKVMHCELVHRVGALCTGLVPWCALIVCTDSMARCTVVHRFSALPWWTILVLYPGAEVWSHQPSATVSPILATHPPPSSTPHQPYLPTTKDPEHPIDDSLSWTDVAILATDLIHLRVISTPSLSHNSNTHIPPPNNLLCSCSSLWDFFSLLGANYWHFCITKWFLAPKCPLEWFDKI